MSEGNGGQTRNPIVVGIACAVLIGYGLVTWFLFQNVGVPSETWTRYTFLLGGIEAIAFAAVGYLFGKEVHRQQAEKAEKRAQDAQGEVVAANNRAVDAERKGRDLTDLLQTKATTSVASDARAVDSSDYHLKEVAAFARHLFPE
jgi:hypothetical protein